MASRRHDEPFSHRDDGPSSRGDPGNSTSGCFSNTTLRGGFSVEPSGEPTLATAGWRRIVRRHACGPMAASEVQSIARPSPKASRSAARMPRVSHILAMEPCQSVRTHLQGKQPTATHSPQPCGCFQLRLLEACLVRCRYQNTFSAGVSWEGLFSGLDHGSAIPDSI